MKKILLLAMTVLALIFSSCEVEDEGVYREQVVVDGFMIVGEPLTIRLTHTVPIGQYYDKDSVKVTGADVMIEVDDRVFHLSEDFSGAPGTYQLPADSHVVTTGKTYHLTVIRDADTVTAVTTASEAVHYTFASGDTVEYGGDLFYTAWDHLESEWGFGMLIECLEEEKYGEDCDFGEDNGPGQYAFAWTVRDDSTFALPWVSLCYTGEHRIRLYACDEALWNYFNTFFIGDADNLPISNVVGGQGLFSATGEDEVYFIVTDDIED